MTSTFHAIDDADADRKAFSGLHGGNGMPSCPRALVCVDDAAGSYELRDIHIDPNELLPEEGDMTEILRDRVEILPGERLVGIA